MVRFGYDETLESADASLPKHEDRDASQHAQNSASQEPEPESRLHIPGSFVFDTPVRPTVRQTPSSSRSQLRSPRNVGNHEESVADVQMIDSEEEEGGGNDEDEMDRSASIGPSDRQETADQDSIVSETSTVSTEVLDIDLMQANDWPSQLRAHTVRFRVLEQARSRLRSSTKRGHLESTTQSYTAQDLDNDLFGPSKSVIGGTSRERTGQKGALDRSCPEPRPFVFQWSHGGLLTTDQKTPSISFKTVSLANPGSDYNSYLTELLKQSTFESGSESFATTLGSLKAQSMLSTGKNQQDQSIWHLAAALFDPLEVEDKAVQDAMRKNRATSWLQNTLATLNRGDSREATTSAEKIYDKLVAYQLSEACAIALSNGDFHLATLLPLAGGDSSVRADLVQQLVQWEKDGVAPHIDEYYTKIYQLLAGDISSYTAGHNKLMPHWQQEFGLHLWFGTTYESPLVDAVRSYQDSLDNRPASATQQAEEDVHFQLLQLHAHPAHSRQKFLDLCSDMQNAGVIRLTPWLLYIYLFERKTSHSEDGVHNTEDAQQLSLRFDQITAQLAEQFDLSGNWGWAVFVALHMHHALARESLIKTLLARNASSMTPELEQFLTSKLKLPSTWIVEATTLSLRNRGLHDQETRHLIKAGMWSEAHATLLKHVAPQGIISGHLATASELLQQLSRCESLTDWEQGGQIYQDAIEIIESAAAQGNMKNAVSLHVGRLIKALPSMYQRTFEQRVAKHEIIVMLTNLLSKNVNSEHGAKSLVDLERVAWNSSSIRLATAKHYYTTSAA